MYRLSEGVAANYCVGFEGRKKLGKKGRKNASRKALHKTNELAT